MGVRGAGAGRVTAPEFGQLIDLREPAPVRFELQETFQSVPRGTDRKVEALRNDDAERAVLGALLIAPDHGIGAELATVLTTEMFAVPAHRAIYDALARLRSDRIPVDPMTMRAALEAGGLGASVAAVTDLVGLLFDEVPTVAHAAAHAALVRAAAQRRALVALGRQLQQAATDPALAVEHTVDRVSRELLVQARPAAKEEGFQHIKGAAAAALQAMDDRRAGAVISGVSTGIPELDDALGGPPQRGTMVLVAGVPSCGKTSTVWQILQGIALERRGAAAFVSAEMRTAMLMNWAYASLGSVPLTRVQSGELEGTEAQRLVSVYEHLSQSPLYVDQTNRPAIEDVVTRCRLLKAQQPDLVAIGVDFLQLVQQREERRADLREEVLRRIAYDLKAVALECDVVMYVLAQVNAKQVASRPDRRPLESDIAGSSGPMEAADSALLVYREQMYNPAAENDMEIAVAKNKFGPRGGVARVWWEGSFVRVASPKRRHEERAAAAERDRQPTLTEGAAHG